MRYELRQWTDSTQTKYVVKSTSDTIEALRALRNKPSIPNKDWYRLHIVDTETETQV